MTPIQLKIITAISSGQKLQSVIDNNGYSHWQLVSGLESLLSEGMLIRQDRSFILTDEAIGILTRRAKEEKERAVEPLNEFRIAQNVGPAKIEIGRQTMAHIQNRVSS